MYARLMAPAAFAAAVLLSIQPVPAAIKTLPKPVPTATPLKTIKHVYSSSRLCAGLKRSVGPAIGKMLQNDKTIATSRPLLQDFVKSSSLGSQGGRDIAVERLEGLVGPLVKNTQSIEQLLNDPVYAKRAQNDNDKQLLTLRAQLKTILDQQKAALDLISGFVDTEQLGELKAAGHEYDSAINGGATPQPSTNASNYNNQGTSPSATPDPILNAGVGSQNDPNSTHANDPRYQGTNNALGYNPLNAFDQQMLAYQSQIAQSESHATITVMRAVPVCGGQVPPPAGAASPAPAVPVPSPTPAPLSSLKP
ncbi:MAG TPA: hypothetical protein VFL13_15410 [Candidatus Baltobacteraceae bacterium]|nr:hypothetical protein [Candidatus Baltobacteraceae bacterium]